MNAHNNLDELWNMLDEQRVNGYRSAGPELVAYISALFYLRWVDRYETEQEAIASFDEVEYHRAIPWNLRWDVFSDLPEKKIYGYFQDKLIPALKQGGRNPLKQTLSRIVSVFEKNGEQLKTILPALVGWADQIPFETPADFRNAGELIDKILVEIGKRTKFFTGEYGTPEIVTNLMVELVNPRPGDRIYDPCFGTGGLLLACAKQLREEAAQMPPRTWLEVRENSIYGIEMNPMAYVIGLTRLVLSGIESPGLELGNTLERPVAANHADEKFDCILANPPWGGRIVKESQSHYPVKTSDTLGLFVQHVMFSLRPKGRAVIAVPNGFLFRTGPEKQIRRKLLEQFQVEGVITLPAGTFLPYTGIESNLLLIRRDDPGKDIKFMRVTELESRKTRDDLKSIQKEAHLLAQKFRTGVGNSLLWETSIKDLSKRDWDLQARRTGDDNLEKFLRSIQEIEEDILVEPLEKAAEVFTGFSYDKTLTTTHKQEAALPLIRVADISEETINTPDLFLNEKARERISENKMKAKPGDVLVSASGTIGKINIIDNKSAGAIPAKSIITIRCRETVLSEYIYALLVSEPYKKWIKGHARGATIQHLSVRTLRNLSVPLPELQIQQKVYKTWQDQGGDPANILLRVLSGADMDPLVSWLESAPEVIDLLNVKQFEGRDDRLLLLEKFIRGIKEQRDTAVHSPHKALPYDVMTWLISIEKALLNLEGISDIPAGTAKYSMLETSRLSIQNLLHSFGKPTLPVKKTIKDLSDKLRELLGAEIESMLAFDGFEIKAEPEYIRSGTESDVSLFIKNPTALVFKNLSIVTTPDYGNLNKGYVAEKEEFILTLRCPPRVAAGRLDFLIKYKFLRLDGKKTGGEIPYSLEVKSIRGSLHTDDIGLSPYNGQKAIERREMFFGRKDIIDRIVYHLTKLQPAGVISLEGNRRIGKTSILKRIMDEDWLQGHNVVYCDLQGGIGEQKEPGLTTAEIFRLMARDTGLRLYDYGIETWIHNSPPPKGERPFKKELQDAFNKAFSDKNPVEIFEGYLQDVFKSIRPNRLLLMLDEFDKIQEGIEAGITSPMVMDNLRYFVQKYNDLSIMIVGSRHLKHLRNSYSSPLFGLGETIVVGPLRREDAALLVTEPVKERLSYVPEARDKITFLCACRANLVQMMCNELFFMAKQQGKRIISSEMVEKTAKKLTDDNEHFATLWEENCHSERQRFILILCVRMSVNNEIITFLTIEDALREYGVPISDDEALESDVEFLAEMELIERFSESGKDQYRISVPLMADWLRHIDFDIQLRKAIREGEAR